MADKKVEKARKRALSSSLIRDLQEQYGHGPEEILVSFFNEYFYLIWAFILLCFRTSRVAGSDNWKARKRK